MKNQSNQKNIKRDIDGFYEVWIAHPPILHFYYHPIKSHIGQTLVQWNCLSVDTYKRNYWEWEYVGITWYAVKK